MTTDKQTKSAVIAWLNGHRDFQQGITILMQTGFKPGVTAKLYRVGKTAPSAHERLTYLMREFLDVFGKTTTPADTDPELAIYDGKEAPTAAPQKASRAILAAAKRNDTPPNISKVIREYASLYKKREKSFRLMGELPETNDTATMARRKQLSDDMEAAVERMEQLYPKYEQYLNSGQDIQPEEADESEEPTDADEDPVSGSSSWDDMTLDELRRERKIRAIKMTRTKNMLLYGNYVRQKQENPLPEGPVRVKYETRKQRLENEINDIDTAIAKKIA